MHLKKSVAIVHMYPLQGNYTLLMRQVLNALLAVAWNHWRSLSAEEQTEAFEKRMVPRFRTTITELRSVLERTKESLSTERVYEVVNALYSLPFRFDAMDDFGEGWGVRSRIISQWSRPFLGSGILEWEHPPDVFQLLMNPARFAQIDMRLLNALTSKYAAALYENTARYVSVKLTKRLPVAEWVRLITSDSNAYSTTEYKYFKRYVLTPALTELSVSEFCPVQVTLLETKGVRGKVTHLQFQVELRQQFPLKMGARLVADRRLEGILLGWGVSQKSINELAVAFEEQDLWRIADVTVDRVKKGNVRNPAAYFTGLCNAERAQGDAADLEMGQPEGPPAQQVRILSAPPMTGSAIEAETAFHRLRAQRIRDGFAQLDEPARQAYLQQYFATASKSLREKLSKGVGHSKGADNVFFGWLANNGGEVFLSRPEELSFKDFLQLNHDSSNAS